MCLITEQQEAEITTEDIICYKEMYNVRRLDGKVFRSVYQPFFWELNILYETKLKKGFDTITANMKSLEYYFEKLPKLKGINIKRGSYQSIFNKLNYVSIGPGFHAMLKRIPKKKFESDNKIFDGDPDFRTIIQVKCRIPAGSQVYRDATGLIVSNRIIILEELQYGRKSKVV